MPSTFFLQLVSAPLNRAVVERHFKTCSPSPRPHHKSVSTVISLERGYHQGNVILRNITSKATHQSSPKFAHVYQVSKDINRTDYLIKTIHC